MKKREKGTGKAKKSRTSPIRSETLMELAKLYWRLVLESLAIGLGIWILVILGPMVGIGVPPLFFMPTAYMIALVFFRDRSSDRVRAFSFAVLIGFLFLLIVSAIAPYVFQFVTPLSE